MKKRGFTLIELIAVIVVLAIIALIATPKIVRVIKDARREATERSAERCFVRFKCNRIHQKTSSGDRRLPLIQ